MLLLPLPLGALFHPLILSGSFLLPYQLPLTLLCPLPRRIPPPAAHFPFFVLFHLPIPLKYFQIHTCAAVPDRTTQVWKTRSVYEAMSHDSCARPQLKRSLQMIMLNIRHWWQVEPRLPTRTTQGATTVKPTRSLVPSVLVSRPSPRLPHGVWRFLLLRRLTCFLFCRQSEAGLFELAPLGVFQYMCQ